MSQMAKYHVVLRNPVSPAGLFGGLISTVMILWFKSKMLLLGKVTPQPQLKKELFTNQHVVQLKQQKLQSSIIKTKKRATMIFFIIGGGNMWGFHLHFLIHPTINLSHTVMLLQLLFFMEMNSRIFLRVCINKENPTLNHKESNFWKALHCTSTVTELAVLAIYAEAVSYPYMKAICTSDAQKRTCLTWSFSFSCL